MTESTETILESIDQFLRESQPLGPPPGKDYYEMNVSNPDPIPSVIKSWAEDHAQLTDAIVHGHYAIEEVLPYREYQWTRETSRPGSVRVDGEWEHFETGEGKWDALKSEMQKNGWPERMPLKLMVGRDGCAKVGEGNHRLAVADRVGINRVPVQFIFQQNVDNPARCI